MINIKYLSGSGSGLVASTVESIHEENGECTVYVASAEHKYHAFSKITGNDNEVSGVEYGRLLGVLRAL